jgi:hypothetical protein
MNYRRFIRHQCTDIIGFSRANEDCWRNGSDARLKLYKWRGQIIHLPSAPRDTYDISNWHCERLSSSTEGHLYPSWPPIRKLSLRKYRGPQPVSPAAIIDTTDGLARSYVYVLSFVFKLAHALKGDRCAADRAADSWDECGSVSFGTCLLHFP